MALHNNFPKTPWEGDVNPIWLSTSLSLRRNLAKYHFPIKMEKVELQQTWSILQEHLEKTPGILLKAEEVSALDKEFLFEHFLCGEGFQNTLSGQGFAIDPSRPLFIQINTQDHLHLQLIDSQGSWENAWNTLSQLEMELGQAIDFAFNPKFGYLTSDPALCGTGLVVRAFLHLPALIHMEQLSEALLKQKEEGFFAAGMSGSLEELTGDIVILSNSYTLGVSEEQILRGIHALAMKLMALEKTLRSHLQTESSALFKDHVSRSLGLLLHSFQLQTKEALDALSFLKLGLHLGWVTGISEAALNALFFQLRRAHLLHSLGEEELADPQEIAQRRAALLHQKMQGVALTFES
ncbi:MAG: protein arginine kinase [Verrucomicrobia bacterium]|nr:protein arginine kinase [Verrucomicrobiota bacterium]